MYIKLKSGERLNLEGGAIINGDVYIKGIGGYLGTEDALPAEGDLATVISNLSEAVTVATLAEIDALFDGGGGGGSGSL